MITLSSIEAQKDPDFLAILPPKLYKYRNWATEHGSEILENLWIFYAYTDLFSDKNDCHPIIEDPTIGDLYEFSKRENPGFNEVQHQSMVRQLWEHYYNTDVSERFNRNLMFEKAHDDYYGVLCLSIRPDNNRLWSDNSKDHNGFCVEFNPYELIKYIPIGGAGLVEYRNSVPRLPFGDFSPEISRLTYFIKTNEYQKEEEFRITKHYNHRLSMTERNIPVPSNCIKRIFIDSQMNQWFKDEICRVVNNRWEIIPMHITLEEQ